MHRRQILRLLAASPFLFPALMTAAEDATYKQFRKDFGNLSSISLSFSGDQASGTLSAKKGGSYHVELRDRAFVCDGKSIWTVQRSTKTVVIDHYNASNAEASIDQVFFVVFNVYKHTSTKVLGKGRKQITLEAPSKDAQVAGIDKIVLVIQDPKRVESIVVHEGAHTTRWTIDSLRLNPTMPDSEFTYITPNGWQIVDLR